MIRRNKNKCSIVGRGTNNNRNRIDTKRNRNVECQRYYCLRKSDASTMTVPQNHARSHLPFAVAVLDAFVVVVVVDLDAVYWNNLDDVQMVVVVVVVVVQTMHLNWNGIRLQYSRMGPMMWWWIRRWS